MIETYKFQDFPGDLAVKTLPSKAGVVDSITGWGVKIPHASGPKAPNMKKQKQCCNKFNRL